MRVLYPFVVALTGLCFVANGPVNADEPTADESNPPDTATATVTADNILALARSGDYEIVNRYVDDLLRDDDEARHTELSKLLVSFRRAEPKFFEVVDDWAAQYPRAFAALAAQGLYYAHLIDVIRGSVRYEVTEWQRIEMKRRFRLARNALTRARDLHPTVPFIHKQLFQIYGDVGDVEKLVASLDTAIDNLSEPSIAFWWFTGAIVPLPVDERERAMEARDQAFAKAGVEPDSFLAEGLRSYLEAAIARREERLSDALPLYDRAIAAGAPAEIRLARANALLVSGQFERAEFEFEVAAKELGPEPFVLFVESRLKNVTANGRDALEHVLSVLARDPYNPYLLLLAAGRLVKVDRDFEAIASLERARVYGEGNAVVHLERARQYGLGPEVSYSEWPGSVAMMFDAYELAIEYAPYDPEIWLSYSLALWKQEDCRAVPAARAVETHCVADNICALSSEFTAAIRQWGDEHCS